MEIWRDIPGFEGRYQVSSLGRIKTLEGKHSEKILKKRITRCGYISYRLFFDKKYYQKTGHRLVMLTFKGYSKLDVNHIDGNKLNNNLENLEYCTKSENMKHAFKNGLCKIKKGKEHYLYGKLGKDNKDSVKVKQLDMKGNLIKIWGSIAEIKRETGISAGNICMCCKGKRNHTGGYKWIYAI